MKNAPSFSSIEQGLRHIMGPEKELVFTSRRTPGEVKAFLKKAPPGGMISRGADVSLGKTSIEITWTRGMETRFFSPMFRGEIHQEGTGSIIHGNMFGAGIRQWPIGLQIFLIALGITASMTFRTFVPIPFLVASYLPSEILFWGRKEKITNLILDACSSPILQD